LSGPPTRTDTTVADAGEPALIDRVRARAGTPPDFVTLGIGDDAAVVEPARGELDVITTDVLVEGVHFRRDWTDARSIGAKAVAVNLSDLAAMGATPRLVLLSLVLPPALTLADFDALVDGVCVEAAGARAALVGGNIARSPGPLVVDVTAMGAVGRRRVLRRSGGRAGDELYMTGAIGAAAAGLAMLRAGVDRTALDPESADCLRRYEHPSARVRCGRVVAASRSASACIDLSDGLAEAARQLAAASGTGVVLDAESIPLAPGASRWLGTDPNGPGTDPGTVGTDPIQAALTGGEDYELLFAVPPHRRRAFLGAMRRCQPLPATRIGRLTADSGASLSVAGVLGPLGQGFRHFQA